MTSKLEDQIPNYITKLISLKWDKKRIKGEIEFEVRNSHCI